MRQRMVGLNEANRKQWVHNALKRAREREKQLEDLFTRSSSIKKKNFPKKRNPRKRVTSDNNMSYEIRIPTKRLDSIFGSGYPPLKMYYKKTSRFIEKMYCDMYGLTDNPFDFSESVPSIKVVFKPSPLSPTNKCLSKYVIEVKCKSQSLGYMTATKIEKHALGLKNISSLNPRRIAKQILWTRVPRDLFLLNELNFAKTIEWLQDNTSSHEYQIFSKFGNDFTLGFSNPEHATMFKLAFGDQELTEYNK